MNRQSVAILPCVETSWSRCCGPGQSWLATLSRSTDGESAAVRVMWFYDVDTGRTSGRLTDRLPCSPVAVRHGTNYESDDTSRLSSNEDTERSSYTCNSTRTRWKGGNGKRGSRVHGWKASLCRSRIRRFPSCVLWCRARVYVKLFEKVSVLVPQFAASCAVADFQARLPGRRRRRLLVSLRAGVYDDWQTWKWNDLQRSNIERDHGVLIDCCLDFSEHISKTTHKVNSIMTVIRRTFTQLDCQCFYLLFKSLTRPQLEYGVPIWFPYKIDI